jgi:uncharacterized protein YkwD
VASRPQVASAGRHRRTTQLPARGTLLGILAALTIMLASGVGLSLTAVSGDAADPLAGDDPVSALGAAPAVVETTAAPDPPTSPEPSKKPEPQPEPEPEPEPQAEPEPEPTDEVDEITALEDRVTELTNAERVEAGCGDLVTDDRLRESAGAHSQDMAANDYFDHTSLDGRSPFERMADAGYPDPAAENIAAGYRTPADVMAGWMDSAGHRDNILNCSLRAVGVGLAYSADGRAYWTQNFGR